MNLQNWNERRTEAEMFAFVKESFTFTVLAAFSFSAMFWLDVIVKLG